MSGGGSCAYKGGNMSEVTGNALISVYDKTGIVEFANGLAGQGWQIYASGGTARKIGEAGIGVTDVSELVGGEAILGHRVVTLSSEVYAGLLADHDKAEEMEEL
jgi:phosphoribosylaminoimidazolecarboxamide formyltransferase/IMP cyclohydrolase